MSIQQRSGDLGVDFASHEIRVPDCAVEILEEKGSKKLNREGRKRGMSLRKLLHCLCLVRVYNLDGA